MPNGPKSSSELKIRQKLGKYRFAQPAEREARHGDAELGRRDRPIQVSERAEEQLRPGDALPGELLDSRSAHAHEGEFGGHEECVEEDECHQRPDADDDEPGA